ncbi:hypothetical protein H8B02_45900, partial [Bradyrhizobium sp. Pear77]|uniref:hypothetical protein n=1 Tax=Bradyrhizobium altum TaxID=1571202 RepID=UPI001E4D2E97
MEEAVMCRTTAAPQQFLSFRQCFPYTFGEYLLEFPRSVSVINLTVLPVGAFANRGNLEIMLEGLACSKAERVAELKKRKQRFQQIKAHPADREKMIADGWSATGRELKDGRLVFEKSKTHDEILENRFWSVLYYLGYDELNAGRKFKIQITDSKGDKDVSKQVDVFAKDDDTVVVAECKSAATKSARNLQKDIMEFAALQRSIVRTV